MALSSTLIGELKHESSSTKKLLERVPAEKFDWSPHSKSMKLGRLAKHIAELNLWVERILNSDEFDFATANFNSNLPESTEAILKIFDEKIAEATAALQQATDDDLNKMWTARRNGQVMFTMPKKVALRSFSYNHIYHHRGQLTVYLRLLDIPVPGMYGPTADERF
jgi:uncharacterized damage-inducible protein DinB